MFSLDEIDRYQRQVVLAEWGAAGQEAVRAAKVTVGGAGEAAEAAVLYLVAAGVGTVRAEAFLDEARAANPHVVVASCAPSGAPGATAAIEGGALIAGDEERAAVGAAVAVEALKAILGLAHEKRVTLPSVSG